MWGGVQKIATAATKINSVAHTHTYIHWLVRSHSHPFAVRNVYLSISGRIQSFFLQTASPSVL